MVANGLAMPLPAMSGAEPWIGSYKPHAEEFREADGNMPIEPVNIAAAEGMYPRGIAVVVQFGKEHVAEARSETVRGTSDDKSAVCSWFDIKCLIVAQAAQRFLVRVLPHGHVLQERSCPDE